MRRHPAGDLAQAAGARRAGLGTASSRPRVYGWLCRANSASVRGLLDGAPGVHDHDPVGEVGDHAEVVRDEQDRGADLGRAGRAARRGCRPARSRRARWSARRRPAACGRQATAIAIITRCRMPPESWCGYSRSRRCRQRDADQVEQFGRPPARPPRRACRWWRRSTSPIWRPDGQHRVERGHRLLEDVGDVAAAHVAQPATRAARAATGRPSRTEPVMVALRGSSRVSAIAVTLLPQPDSPTRASTSPLGHLEGAASTASTGPSSVRKRTLRSRTASRAAQRRTRLGHRSSRVSRGSSASRRPSPSRFSAEGDDHDADARAARPATGRPGTAAGRWPA